MMPPSATAATMISGDMLHLPLLLFLWLLLLAFLLARRFGRHTRRLRRAGRQAAQQIRQRQAERRIENAEAEEGQWNSGGRRHAISGAHDVVDDPRLAANFCDHPTGFQRHKAERRADQKRPQEPGVGLAPATP